MGLVAKFLKVTVTTAGTAVPILKGSTDGLAQDSIVRCIIQPQANSIVVGDSTALYSTLSGIKLVASTNDKLELSMDTKNGIDLAKVFIDASTSSTAVSVLLFYRK